MRLKVSIDVRHPLKRRMRIKKAGGKWFWVDFKYERLHIFCYICVLLGHTEWTCPKLYESAKPVAKPYSQWMRAPNQKSSMNSGDRWLGLAPPEKEDQSFGNYTNSAEVMAVDFDGATKFGIDGSSNHGMATNGGIVLNKEIQIILTPCTQSCNVGKTTEKGAMVTIISKETEYEFNSGLIVTDAKRRRAAFGPHDMLKLMFQTFQIWWK